MISKICRQSDKVRHNTQTVRRIGNWEVNRIGEGRTFESRHREGVARGSPIKYWNLSLVVLNCFALRARNGRAGHVTARKSLDFRGSLIECKNSNHGCTGLLRRFTPRNDRMEVPLGHDRRKVLLGIPC